jgi:hypothetical protein
MTKVSWSAQQQPKRRVDLDDSGADHSAATARQELEVRYAHPGLTRKQHQRRRADLEAPEA